MRLWGQGPSLTRASATVRSAGREKTTVRGVMIWLTTLVSRARMLRMLRSSLGRMMPARRVRLTTARMSSSVWSGLWRRPRTARPSQPPTQITGMSSTTSQRTGRARRGARLRVKITPRVLGMISEKIRMTRVNPAANQPRCSGPNTAAKAAPAMAAPAVLATVFRVRMAVMGCSTLVRRFSRIAPEARPCFLSISTRLQGTE